MYIIKTLYNIVIFLCICTDINHIIRDVKTNNNYNQIMSNIEMINYQNELDKALLKIEYLEKTIKNKEEIIELLKKKQ